MERGSPWLFKQYAIHVQRWNKDTELGVADFSVIPLWVQLWEMPDFCKTKEAAKDWFEDGQIIRIASPDKKCYDIQLKYEKLGMYCRCCGFLGHETRNCDNYLSLSASGAEVDLKWKADLKADQLGWRYTEMKENTNPNRSGKITTLNPSNKKPTPVSLLRSFANLSCQERNSEKNAEIEDNISSIPIMIDSNAAAIPAPASFQLGSNQKINAKRYKK
ncbi:hypothetical protein PIB30_000816 [Stylosanthes scabra]|uniref:Zinc knuckle CX2CX4HX4C domain-containing protein n=1 Tax=Stylosanthes scabra TaxID=79078 RepID=A0ABU6Q3E0_9FABA|nr:hypothetical protein [Stylosanthes scabra]